MGETGRYPLVYQSIKLTLKYYQRINKLKPGTIIYEALQEQKSLNLSWYKNIDSILQVDNLYHKDHVTAFKFLYGGKNSNYQTNTHNSPKIPSHLTHLKVIQPLPSKKFRIEEILKTMKDYFRIGWENEKSNSIKLSLFYNKIKHSFKKEEYLDLVTNASYRYRTTKLRISAHDLEIEHGRYKNIPREDRICKWCKITLNANVVENEDHVLFSCDLYSNHRRKLINTIRKCRPKIMQCKINHPFETLSFSNLNSQLFTIQSKCKSFILDNCNCITDSETPLEASGSSTSNHNHDKNTLLNASSYILNAISTFIGKCFDKRSAFKKDLLNKTGTSNSIDM